MVLHGYCRRIAVLPHTWQQKSRLEGEFSTSTSFVLVTSGLCLQPRTSTCITIQIRLSISLVKLPKANPQVGARNPVLPPAPFVRFFRTFVLSFWPSVGLLEERCLTVGSMQTHESHDRLISAFHLRKIYNAELRMKDTLKARTRDLSVSC